MKLGRDYLLRFGLRARTRKEAEQWVRERTYKRGRAYHMGLEVAFVAQHKGAPASN